jgi:hypothetical protein
MPTRRRHLSRHVGSSRLAVDVATYATNLDATLTGLLLLGIRVEGTGG